jgi:hypothetical protein
MPRELRYLRRCGAIGIVDDPVPTSSSSEKNAKAANCQLSAGGSCIGDEGRTWSGRDDFEDLEVILGKASPLHVFGSFHVPQKDVSVQEDSRTRDDEAFREIEAIVRDRFDLERGTWHVCKHVETVPLLSLVDT